MEDTLVLCISRDLPFAQKRFCAAEGLEKVIPLSDYENGSFGKSYGLTMEDGPLAHLLSRAIIIIDQEGRVRYTQQVSELSEVPDYQAALEAL
jgi:thiol peroxidase